MKKMSHTFSVGASPNRRRSRITKWDAHHPEIREDVLRNTFTNLGKSPQKSLDRNSSLWHPELPTLVSNKMLGSQAQRDLVKRREMQSKERQLAIEVGLREKRCCGCIAIKTGLVIIAFLFFVGAIIGFTQAVYSVLVFNAVGLAILLLAIPNFYGGYLCMQWLNKDQLRTRAGLTLALQIELVYYFLMGIMSIIYEAVHSQLEKMIAPPLIGWILGFLIMIYFVSVSRSYQFLWGDIIEDEEVEDAESFAE